MIPNYSTTEAEHKVLGFMDRILGGNLAKFILTGLGEVQPTQRRVFTAFDIPSSNYQITRQFETVNQGLHGLPIGRDPLILAALLQQLWIQEKRTNEVTFQDEMLLSTLEWSNIPDSHLIIQQAIERYFSTAFYLVDNDLPESERIEGPYSHCCSLLVAYDTSTDRSLENPDQKNSLIIVRFSPDFLEGISSEQKYFLDLDFESLHSFRQIS
jgi:hypothetical protein